MDTVCLDRGDKKGDGEMVHEITKIIGKEASVKNMKNVGCAPFNTYNYLSALSVLVCLYLDCVFTCFPTSV